MPGISEIPLKYESSLPQIYKSHNLQFQSENSTYSYFLE